MYLNILEYLHLSFNKWPSIQYKLSVSLVLWNHNNGEDGWLGRGPDDNHWHPQQKRVSPRRSLLKGVALHRVLYQSILNAKLTGRKRLDRKRCISNRDDRKLENTANAVSSAGVGLLCFLKSTVNPAIYQDILEQTRLIWTPCIIYGVLSRGRWETPDKKYWPFSWYSFV